MSARKENAFEAVSGLKPEEHQCNAKLAALRSAIDEEDESGFTDGN